jgi:hypothetical protein
VRFQLSVKRLGKARLSEPDNFCAFQSKVLFQIFRLVMLDDGIMRERGENFRPAIFRDVRGDQDKVQLAFAAQQRFASGEQNARTQDKWEQTFHRFGRSGFFHNLNIDVHSPSFSFFVCRCARSLRPGIETQD